MNNTCHQCHMPRHLCTCRPMTDTDSLPAKGTYNERVMREAGRKALRAKAGKIETFDPHPELPERCECGGKMLYSESLGQVFSCCDTCTPTVQITLKSLKGKIEG